MISYLILKIRSIITGFYYLIFGAPKEILQMANERKEICNECGLRNGKFCSECGCLINAKVRSVLENCPVGKW